jgi:hypothetical protein
LLKEAPYAMLRTLLLQPEGKLEKTKDCIGQYTDVPGSPPPATKEENPARLGTYLTTFKEHLVIAVMLSLNLLAA